VVVVTEWTKNRAYLLVAQPTDRAKAKVKPTREEHKFILYLSQQKFYVLEATNSLEAKEWIQLLQDATLATARSVRIATHSVYWILVLGVLCSCVRIFLNGGISDLSGGVGDLNGGVGDLSRGVCDLNGGINDLSGGVGDLNPYWNGVW
jgi:X-X-X-Leu-X-X-Gly heptad repeat protein